MHTMNILLPLVMTKLALLINGQIVIDKHNIANLFNQYFTCIGQELADKLPPAPLYTPANPQISQSMPENKAVGLDKLPDKLLRVAVPIIAQPLAFI